ncbi:hypothetical protein OPT61_g6030 [Boeremia exigua]|uniref:Uncharacterized protein n=1 Tax=Boeremia exigua TaxID=749465 RepID=A0ACC2I855_9PLEO|nr:hypothetical protein OPT61_g6030 [Boeremia exigua]
MFHAEMTPTLDNANDLMVKAAAIGLEQLHELRVMALGNAKIIYGSEKFKFYDVVVAYSEPDAKFAVILVCNFNEATKILRKEVARCPLAAARAMIRGLHADTGLLLSKYDVGDQIFGQQGSTSSEGNFGLYEWKHAVSDPSQDKDETSSLVRGGFPAPVGPRAERFSSKRTRRETDRGDYWDRDSETRESEGRLRYDD